MGKVNSAKLWKDINKRLTIGGAKRRTREEKEGGQGILQVVW